VAGAEGESLDGTSHAAAGTHESNTRFRSRGPIPPVAPLGTTSVPTASERAYGAGQPLRAGDDGTQAHGEETKKGAPDAIGSHQDKEVKLEFGNGTITGELTARFQFGNAGVPLAGEQLTTFKNTLGVRLNGFATKVETALLDGELELGETMEGLKVALEPSALNIGTDGHEAEIDLLSIKLLVAGDATHWFNTPGLKVTVEGSLKLALGGKLAAQLAEVTAVQKAKQQAAERMEKLGPELEKHAAELKDLETEADALIGVPGSGARRAELTELIWHKKIKLGSVAEELRKHEGDLQRLSRKSLAAMGKLKTRAAKQIAKVMETKVMKFVAEKAMKLIPILNTVSLVLDVSDVLEMLINRIADGSRDGDGGDGGGKKTDPTKPEGEPLDAPWWDLDQVKKREGQAAGGSAKQEAPKADHEAYEAAKKELPMPARMLIESVSRRGLKGPTLTPDQLTTVGLMAHDLKQEELPAVLELLRKQDHVTQTPEELMIAIDQALREVRNRKAFVRVDGKERPDLADPTGERGPIMTPSQANTGPITSPGQVDSGSGTGTQSKPEPLTSEDIVRGLPDYVVARWFEVSGDDLVLSKTGAQWIQEHRAAAIADEQLVSTEPAVANTGPNKWRLEVTFRLRNESGAIRPITHRFAVQRSGEPEFGATAGDLSFQSIVDMGS
jgi:hypothetical protein